MDKDKMTIILFSGEMDKALAALTLATTAASMGMEVSIFFTFWGLNIIRKEGKISPKKHILQKMFGFLNKGGKNKLPLTKFNMAGMGPFMMKKLMKKTKMASVDELLELSRKMKVKFIACTTSCGFMGLDRGNLIEEVDEMAGAASYLAEAKDSKINLFI